MGEDEFSVQGIGKDQNDLKERKRSKTSRVS